MADVLDLDQLLPPSKQIKLNGKFYECKPLTIKQMIQLIKLEKKLQEITTEDEIVPLIVEALSPFIPALKDEKDFDFTSDQLRAVMQFAQKVALPNNIEDTTKEFTPKKKVVLAEELPISSASTEDTQQPQS